MLSVTVTLFYDSDGKVISYCMSNVLKDSFYFFIFQLQMQVDKEVYDLFETKVRDWHLQKDPHFRWCAHVSVSSF